MKHTVTMGGLIKITAMICAVVQTIQVEGAQGACANVAPPALTALYRFEGDTVNAINGIPLPVGIGDSGGFAPGKVGLAARFDGSTGYAGLTGPLAPKNSVTIAFWTRVPSHIDPETGEICTPRGERAAVTAQLDSNDGFAFFSSGFCDLGGRVAFNFMTLDQDLFQKGPVEGMDGPRDQWTHFAVTYDGFNLVGYTNGERAFRIHDGFEWLVPGSFFDKLRLGFNPVGDGPLIGNLDEVAIWNIPLTNAQLREIVAASDGICTQVPDSDNDGLNDAVESALNASGVAVTKLDSAGNPTESFSIVSSSLEPDGSIILNLSNSWKIALPPGATVSGGTLVIAVGTAPASLRVDGIDPITPATAPGKVFEISGVTATSLCITDFTAGGANVLEGGQCKAIDRVLADGNRECRFRISTGSSPQTLFRCDKSYGNNDGVNTAADVTYTATLIAPGTWRVTGLRNSILIEFDDADGDGFAPPQDCNDNNAAIHPDALEVCDGVDNDCNGGVDDVDGDVDGVNDCRDDRCLGTVADGITKLPNQYSWEGRAAWLSGPLNDESLVYTIFNTFGCSCRQIVSLLSLGAGHLKKGCSPSVLESWTGLSSSPDRAAGIGGQR